MEVGDVPAVFQSLEPRSDLEGLKGGAVFGATTRRDDAPRADVVPTGQVRPTNAEKCLRSYYKNLEARRAHAAAYYLENREEIARRRRDRREQLKEQRREQQQVSDIVKKPPLTNSERSKRYYYKNHPRKETQETPGPCSGLTNAEKCRRDYYQNLEARKVYAAAYYRENRE